MAQDILMTLDGIPGESQAQGFEGWIELFSFSNGSSNHSTVAHGTGSGAGKVEFSSISATTQLEVSTPKLFANNWAGKHIAKGTIVVRESTGSDSGPQVYYQYDLTEVFVDSVSVGAASGGGKPSVSYSFSFNSIKVSYSQQQKDGSLKLVAQPGWDVTVNKAL